MNAIFNIEKATEIIENAQLDRDVIILDLMHILQQIHKEVPAMVNFTISDVMREDYLDTLRMSNKDLYDYKNLIDRCNQPLQELHPIPDYLDNIDRCEQLVVIQWPESQKLVKDDYDESEDEHPFIVDEVYVQLIMDPEGVDLYGNASYFINAEVYDDLKKQGILN